MIIIDPNQCIKCAVCVLTCFQGVLRKEPEGIKVDRASECTDCNECIDNCPMGAISKKEEE